MAREKWLVHPGESRVIDIDDIEKLKVGLVGGQVDVVASDEPGIRIEIHSVTGREIRIESVDGQVQIDHAQLRWDNFLESFKNLGSSGPKAEVSIAVSPDVDLTLGVVSASALVSGLRRGARLNTVSGHLIVDDVTGDVTANSVSGDIHARSIDGTLKVNSVSGDIAASGAIRRATADSVSGAIMIDSSGEVDAISLITVSGSLTTRLDDGLPANYSVRTVSGKLLIDGERCSGRSYNGTSGDLAGSFVDVRAKSVSGSVTVLRRPVGAKCRSRGGLSRGNFFPRVTCGCTS